VPVEQSRYQIRFDWGTDGADAIAADADVVVWVDALDRDLGAVPVGSLPSSVGHVIAADLSSAVAAAQWIVTLQQRLGRPVVVAVIAAGATRSDGRFRFAVEDQLAAGSVVAQLGMRGLDATSPEAATAEAAFRGLERAVSHLLTASVTAQSATARSASAQSVGAGIAAGTARNDGDSPADEVTVLRTQE
jgi:2-phosphosulfolactate phosphatase